MEPTTTTKPSVLSELRNERIEMTERERDLVLAASTRAESLATAKMLELLAEDDAITLLPEPTLQRIDNLVSVIVMKQTFASFLRASLAS